MALLGQGAMRKMHVELNAPVQYAFRLDEQLLPVNPLLGQHLQIGLRRLER